MGSFFFHLKGLVWSRFWAWNIKRKIKNMPDPRVSAEKVPMTIVEGSRKFTDLGDSPVENLLFLSCKIEVEESSLISFPVSYSPNLICNGYNAGKPLTIDNITQVRHDLNIKIHPSWEQTPVVEVIEYEEQTPWEHGLGKTAFAILVNLPWKASRILRDNIQAVDKTKPCILVLAIPCNYVDIPNGRKVTPDSQIKDAFKWSIHPNDIGFWLIDFDSVSMDSDGIRILSDVIERSDFIKSWRISFS